MAAIHPNLSGENGTRIDTEGGRLVITNYSMKALIRRAWDVQSARIIGGPGWLDSDRYNIEAKTGRTEKIGSEELKTLLQALLVDRFHLKVHRETKELTCYAMILEKSGPKLKEHMGSPGSSVNDRLGAEKSQMTGDNVSMAAFANYLADRLDRIVADSTDLKGGYDFTLEWASDQAVNPTSPSLFAALREQLGLRLESRKSPVEVLVIDSVEKPSEN